MASADAWVPAAALLGWVWGSFLNQAVDRTPRRDGRGPALGWFRPARSVCLACGQGIAWHDNVPIVSWLVLRGRCRACGASIGLRTLAVEVAAPLLLAGLTARLVRLESGPGTLAAAAGMLSWLLVAVPALLERRRLSPAFLAVGAGLLAALGGLAWG